MCKAFNLRKLLQDILNADKAINSWQDFEKLVLESCRKQDPKCIFNKDKDPDILLSNGYGIEAKSIKSKKRGVNLNSSAPNSKTYYVVGYCSNKKVKNIAIICGINYLSLEIKNLQKTNTKLQSLSNPYLKYRTRIMWQIENPFLVWGNTNFIVNHCGKIIKN